MELTTESCKGKTYRHDISSALGRGCICMLGRKTPELYMEIMNMLQMIKPKARPLLRCGFSPKAF